MKCEEGEGENDVQFVQQPCSLHTMSVSERIQHDAEQSRSQQQTQNCDKLTGFVIQKHGVFKWDGSDQNGALAVPQNSPTVGIIFRCLFTEDVVIELIKSLGDLPKGEKLKQLIHDLWCHLAICIYIYAWSAEKLRTNWPLPQNIFPNAIGFTKYQKLQRYWITPKVVEKLNLSACSLIDEWPESLTLDEKLLPYTGKSPYIRYISNKDPPSGHWISELSLTL